MVSWWKQDVYRRWLLLGGLAYAACFGQGIPLWDDDFTSWFWKIKDKSIFQTLLEVISPISTQPQYWGFNERPIQALVYQIFHLISGYESWSYMLYKAVVYAGLGVMIYAWGMRLVPQSRRGHLAAVAAAVFFLFAPGPMAAHVIHSDLAPTAELLFLILTYLIWEGIEKTPLIWSDFPSWEDPEQKAWIGRWIGLSLCTYLSYKSKADIKLIPGILAVYLLIVRRHQWKLFSLPIVLMGFLAIPWGGAIFHKLPPFVPGSQGSEIGWMWQPASFERLRDFFWTVGPYHFLSAIKDPTLSLAAILGPFLLVGLLVFVVWRAKALDQVPWSRLTSPVSPEDRARTFVLIWLALVCIGISALPGINYIFRVRYGILPLVPTSILLAWFFGLFAESSEKELPRWAVALGIALFMFQGAINLNRSITFRRDLGQVMVAVDQVYEYVAKTYPQEKLALFPDFRPYDYRPDAPTAIRERDWLGAPEDIAKKYQPYKAYAISWKPSLWPALEMVEHFTGCREGNLFDRLFPCPSGTGVYLMRYIGEDPLYQSGEALRNQGDVTGARKVHEEFLAKHPMSLAGQFVIGLEAYQMQDWTRTQQAYSVVERYLPDHLSVLYNHALALGQLGQQKAAIDRLSYIVKREPTNYPALINLYYDYVKDGQAKNAHDVLTSLKAAYPQDPEINRLLAAGK